jgi:hypothetical protein
MRTTRIGLVGLIILALFASIVLFAICYSRLENPYAVIPNPEVLTIEAGQPKFALSTNFNLFHFSPEIYDNLSKQIKKDSWDGIYRVIDDQRNVPNTFFIYIFTGVNHGDVYIVVPDGTNSLKIAYKETWQGDPRKYILSKPPPFKLEESK